MRPVGVGAAIALAFMLLLSLISGPLLSQDRAARISLDALNSGDLPNFDTIEGGDNFTECSILANLVVRSKSPFVNAVVTWRPDVTYWHPCPGLLELATGQASREIPPQQPPYVNYLFGSRYLEAVVLSVTDYATLKHLSRVISYASVAALFVGALINRRRTAYLTAPVYASLLTMFSLHLLGHSLAHAAGFIFGFSILGVLLAARGYFQSFANRLALFAALALIATYFDMLTGAVPVLLSLSLFLNHFFYVRPQADNVSTTDYLKTSLREAAAIVACFVGGYVFLTGLHLALASLVHGGAFQSFLDGLSVRVGSDDSKGDAISPLDLAVRLWLRRDRLSPFGTEPATLFLLASATAWLYAMATIGIAARQAGRKILCDGAILAVAAGGILAWYLLFRNHSYVHAFFTVRLLALPASYGFVAILLVGEAALVSRFSTPRPLIPAVTET